MWHSDVINPIFFQGIVFIDYLVSCALKIITMMMMIIPCTCIASSLLIYLISCWQSPPLTLVNEMRLLLGLQCLVAMVWVRFISCCLAIPRVSWLFFLSTLTTHCLKYNETEPGQSRITVPKRFLSSPTALLSWCLINVLRVEQGSGYKTWDLQSCRPGFNFRLRIWLDVSFSYSLREADLSLSFPMGKMGDNYTQLLECCGDWGRKSMESPCTQ